MKIKKDHVMLLCSLTLGICSPWRVAHHSTNRAVIWWRWFTRPMWRCQLRTH